MTKRRVTEFIFIVVAGIVALSAGWARQDSADLVLVHGKVLAVDERFTIQSAMAVKGGKILAVGGDDLERRYKATTVIDLKGRVLMPGFTDTHVHVRGQSRRDVDLEDATSIREVQRRVAAKAKELGAGEWVTGFGWDEAKFAERRNPLQSDLDAAASNNPVVLTRAGGHSSVGNSLALKIAGITRTTPDPPSGLIEHDAKGEPNGIVRERNDLYTRHVPPATWESIRDSYVAELKALLPLGITSIMEASGSIDDEPVGQGGIANPPGRATYRRVRAIYDEHGGELPRIALYISYPGAERLKAYPHHTGYGDERVRRGPSASPPSMADSPARQPGRSPTTRACQGFAARAATPTKSFRKWWTRARGLAGR